MQGFVSGTGRRVEISFTRYCKHIEVFQGTQVRIIMEVMLEFRAGLAIFANGQVTPDPRKGMLRIALVDDLVHFQWLNRVGKDAVEPAELDIVIFPEEANLAKVTDL